MMKKRLCAWGTGIVLIAVGVMFQPAASAQSFWQRMKQSAQQAERNAQAQQRQRQAQSVRSNGPAAATRNTQSTTADSPAAAPVNVDSPALKALYHKLDVGGLQMGMTLQEARAVLHQRYPSFTENQERPYVFTDLPQTEFLPQIVLAPGGHTDDGNMYIGLTIPPMQPVVLSILRNTGYERDHAPTVDNTVAALRAKYGPESKMTPITQWDQLELIWVFDGAGNQVPGRDVERFLGVCAPMYREPAAGFVSNPETITWSANCKSSTILKATVANYVGNLTNSQGQSLPQGLVRRIEVDAISFPLFMKTIGEARQMVLAAKDANLKKTKKAADQNVPTL